MTEADAASALSAQVSAGFLDRRALDAVLTVAGQKGARVRQGREVEALRLVAREATNADIASQPGLSPKTVERHVTPICAKLGVTTRAGAAIHALENRLLQAEDP